MAKINVKDTEITVISIDERDYISLTDMVRNIENGSALIEKWLRNKNTIEFLGIWEEMYNPNFNSPEFEGIKNEAGLNRFILSVKQWIEKTNAIGIIAKAGRYGGTYAHKENDKAVLQLYGLSPTATEMEIVGKLMEMYVEMTEGR